MTAEGAPGRRRPPSRSGRVSAPFRDLLSRYGASPRLLRRVDEVVTAAPVAPVGPTLSRSGDPRHRLYSIIAVDAEQWGPEPAGLGAESLTKLVRYALTSAWADLDSVVIEERGDGLLILVPAARSIGDLLGDFVRALTGELGWRAQVHAPTAVRLRVAAHEGFVQVGEHGEAVAATLRLLDSEPLRAALWSGPPGKVALIVSDPVYREAFAGGRARLDPASFTAVTVGPEGGEGQSAWIHVAGRPIQLEPPSPPVDIRAPQAPRPDPRPIMDDDRRP